MSHAIGEAAMIAGAIPLVVLAVGIVLLLLTAIRQR